MKDLQKAIDTIEYAKMDLIHIQDEIPKSHWKKLDTIISKLDILEWQLIEKERSK